jgi:hypothetical protein
MQKSCGFVCDGCLKQSGGHFGRYTTRGLFGLSTPFRSMAFALRYFLLLAVGFEGTRLDIATGKVDRRPLMGRRQALLSQD